MKNHLFSRIVAFFAILMLANVSLYAEAVVFPENKEDFHVFLLMGQSNMEGYYENVGEMDTTPHPRVLKMNSWGSWELAVDPITNNHDVAVGPGLAFAKKMAEENPEITIGLIPLAVGGTPISMWQKGTPFYQSALQSAAIARQSGTLKGVLWHQGENDTWFGSTAVLYGENLRVLIDNFRMDVRDAYLPWIIGAFTDSPISKDINSDTVWSSIKWIGTNDFRTGYVRSKDVPYQPNDQIHFTTEGMRIMGERYANEYLKVTGYWTDKGKALLDEEAVDNGDGWKYHDQIGVYHDKYYPIIKHAQLGWLEIEFDSEMEIRVDSPFLGKDIIYYGRQPRSIGKFLVQKNEDQENSIYLYKEDLSEPETPMYPKPYSVNLLAEKGDEFAFYDYNTNQYLTNLPNLPVFENAQDYNRVTEYMFLKTQESAQLLIKEINKKSDGSWGEMRRFVDDVQMYRNYTNYMSWEGYHFVDQNDVEFKDFWKGHFINLLYFIDPYVKNSQRIYQENTNEKLNSR